MSLEVRLGKTWSSWIFLWQQMVRCFVGQTTATMCSDARTASTSACCLVPMRMWML
uniref:Uncharacterized protein n=1 Tax=Arundo donax TaxID=35708 RepID=A0A0A8YKA9_ARUDO